MKKKQKKYKLKLNKTFTKIKKIENIVFFNC